MPQLCLYFPKNADDANWAGSSYVLDAPDDDQSQRRGGEWVIGRLPTCDITITTQSISRKHCAIGYSYAAKQWTITDLGGKNGTRLNGKPLRPGDPSPVRIGDKLHLGPNQINLVENPQATEEIGLPTTIAATEPLDYRTGKPLAKATPPPPPPPETPAAAAPPPPPPAPHEDKRYDDALYLFTQWLVGGQTFWGRAARFLLIVLLATLATVVIAAVAL